MRSALIWIFGGLVGLFALLCLPTLVTMVIHDFRLALFAGQLDRVDRLLSDGDFKIGESSHIRVTANDNACTYQAFRQYEIGVGVGHRAALLDQLDTMVFRPAGERDDRQDAEFSYFLQGDVLALLISDGPAPAWFDLRCW